MTKNQFIKELKRNLKLVPSAEKAEIIRDYEEHFHEGMLAGKTEEQICFELGAPAECAKQYTSNGKFNKVLNPPPKVKKGILTGVLILNIIEVAISLPTAIVIFLLGIVFSVLSFYLIPLLNYIPFTMLAISLTASCYIITALCVIITVYEFQIICRELKGGK